MNCPKCGADMIKGRKGWVCEECGERVSSGHDAYDAMRVDSSLDSALASQQHVTSLREGRYAVTETLGQGGMGVVYRAIDTQLKRPVAIKGIQPGLLGIASAEQRFLREAQAVAGLDHPNIIRIYDFFAEGEFCYIVMEFFEGISIASYIAQAGPPGDAKIRALFDQITSALATVHRHGLVHRDIKPSNILVDARGHTKLIDFGLVRGEGALVTKTGTYLGTPGYTAPEQEMDAASADHRADIYSLGAVLYFCVTGGKHPPRVLLPEGIPARYRAAVVTCLASGREDRFADVGELRRALGIDAIQAPPPPPLTPPPAGRVIPVLPEARPTPAAQPPAGPGASRLFDAQQPPSTLFDTEDHARLWDVSYPFLWFLGLLSLWAYAFQRMFASLAMLNEKIARDFRDLLGGDAGLQPVGPRTRRGAYGAVALGFGLAVVSFMLSSFCEMRWLSRGDFEDFAGPLLVLTGVFYLAIHAGLAGWLRALQACERTLLQQCVDALHQATGRLDLGVGAERVRYWRRVWCLLAAQVFLSWLPCWVFGVAAGGPITVVFLFVLTFHSGGMAFFLFPLRKYAQVAQEARRELQATLEDSGRTRLMPTPS